MRLREKQSLFARLLARLLLRMEMDEGVEYTLGEVERRETATHGHTRSLHKKRLAVDVHLFIGGEYQSSTEAHKPYGEWWEAQHELCRWGGRFNDGNHYSLAHEGMR